MTQGAGRASGPAGLLPWYPAVVDPLWRLQSVACVHNPLRSMLLGQSRFLARN